jgi:hypothetical protein
MLYVGIGIGVLAVAGIGYAVLSGGKPEGGKGAASGTSSSAPLTPGIAFLVHKVAWRQQQEGVWSVSGELENKGGTPAENVVIAFYPCGEEPRIKNKQGQTIAVVTHAKIPLVPPGQKVAFTTTPNPPAIQPGGGSLYPAKHSGHFVSCKNGPSLPQAIQEAIFDPLDTEDWGGTETDWQKKRKKGSGAK